MTRCGYRGVVVTRGVTVGSRLRLRTSVLAAPERLFEERPGRVVAQGMIGAYLLRVFVDVDRTPPEVVTVYRTAKLRKYGS